MSACEIEMSIVPMSVYCESIIYTKKKKNFTIF